MHLLAFIHRLRRLRRFSRFSRFSRLPRLPILGLVLAGAAVAAALSGGRTTAASPDPTGGIRADAAVPHDGADNWTEETLEAMSLRQKAAQMIMVRAYGQHRHPDSLEYRELLASVAELGVGGIVLFDSDLESIPRLLDTLQEAAQIPLLVSADLEGGLAFRVRRVE